MKILLVAYSFPPLNDAQSIRWYYLTKVLAESGYKIDVLTVKLPYNYDNDFPIHKNLNVYRIFPGFFEYLSHKVKNSFGVYDDKNAKIRQSLGFLTLKNLYWLFRDWMGKILPGGIKSEWFPFIYKQIDRLNVDNYSAIITSQEPLIDSLIGLLLKKRYGSSIYWIADIGDPMFSGYYPSMKKRVDSYIEKMVLEYADKVIVTNRSIIAYLVGKYRIKRDKIKVITQGFCKDVVRCDYDSKIDDRLNLFFGGTFYDGFREPYNLFEAVEKVDKVRLTVAGSNEKFVRNFKSDKIDFVGVISHSELLRRELESDILINVSNRQRYQLPGKLFEYLGARKPILNIVYDNTDETVSVVKGLNVGIVCKNEVSDIEKAIKFLLNLKGNYSKYFDFENPLIDDFSWKRKAEKVVELLNEKDSNRR